MSVKKSHKTDFSRKAISMLVWKYQILSKHFLFLFWCLKHVLGELGSSPGSSRAPAGAQRRRGRRRGRGRAGPGARRGGGSGEGAPPRGSQAHDSRRSLPRSRGAAPPPSGFAGPGGGFGNAFLAQPDLSQKGGAGSNRKNNSVSQGRQYFSRAQITARQGAPGPEHRGPLGPC